MSRAVPVSYRAPYAETCAGRTERPGLRENPGGGGAAEVGSGADPVRAAVRVGIVMGSDSDLETMSPASDALTEVGIAHELRVVSAHRTPRDMLAYGADAAGRGLRVIIAGAGGAAHLPGMLAAVTRLPVIGVPVPLRYLDGLDSLLSMVQMPSGVPVATVAVGGSRNAGLLAARLLALDEPVVDRALADLADRAAASSRAADRRVATASGATPGAAVEQPR